MSKSENFFEKVYEVAKLIPFGRVTSYGAIAKYLGTARSARMVGWAMNASHNMEEVKRLCDSVLMMKGGTIVDSGTPEHLIRKHGRKNLEEVFLELVRNKNEFN